MSTTEEHCDASSVIFELRELSVRDGLGVREVRPLVLRLAPGRAVEIDLVYASVAKEAVERAGNWKPYLASFTSSCAGGSGGPPFFSEYGLALAGSGLLCREKEILRLSIRMAEFGQLGPQRTPL